MINIKIKYLFALSVLVGVFSILIGSIYNSMAWSILIIAIIMFSYFFIGNKRLSEELISKDQFADSNYYLGFLFTLISLAFSLFLIVNNLEKSDAMINLISQFGLSISTTILGLVFRIYLISFNPTMDSNIENFNVIIFDKLQLLKEYISESIDQAKYFSNVVDEKLNMFTDNTITSIDLYDKKLNTSVDNQIKTIENNNATIETFSDDIKSVEEAISRNSDSLHSSISRFNDFIDSFPNVLQKNQDTIDSNHNLLIEQLLESNKKIIIENNNKIFNELTSLLTSNQTGNNNVLEKAEALYATQIEDKSRSTKLHNELLDSIKNIFLVHEREYFSQNQMLTDTLTEITTENKKFIENKIKSSEILYTQQLEDKEKTVKMHNQLLQNIKEMYSIHETEYFSQYKLLMEKIESTTLVNKNLLDTKVEALATLHNDRVEISNKALDSILSENVNMNKETQNILLNILKELSKKNEDEVKDND